MGAMTSSGRDERHFEKSGYNDRSGHESTALDSVSKEIVPMYGQRREAAACSSLKGISKQYMG